MTSLVYITVLKDQGSMGPRELCGENHIISKLKLYCQHQKWLVLLSVFQFMASADEAHVCYLVQFVSNSLVKETTFEVIT